MRTPFDAMLENVDYQPVEPPKDTYGLPYATHKGKLVIGSAVLDVVLLNTGERMITEESLLRFFGLEGQ